MNDLMTVKRENDEPTEVVVIADGIRYVFPKARLKVTTEIIERDSMDVCGDFTATIVAEGDAEKGWTMFQCFDGEQDAAVALA